MDVQQLYKIRKAKQEDCEIIAAKIKELADHENKGSHVKITKEGKGLGTALLQVTAEAALRRDCIIMMFYVYKENKGAMDFYKRLQAVNLTETQQWQLMEISYDCVVRLANNSLKMTNKYIQKEEL